uniref:Chromodomain-helicase-DNA-binding protein 1-like n=1 Tax=Rhizophora mucronata TaxID=61149 RepID=A0A2P2JP12_RHIMU
MEFEKENPDRPMLCHKLSKAHQNNAMAPVKYQMMRNAPLCGHTLNCADCTDVVCHQHTVELLVLGRICASLTPNHLSHLEDTISKMVQVTSDELSDNL